MSRLLRIDIENGIYRVTSRGRERRVIVRDDRDREHWLNLLDRVAVRCGWQVLAWTLLDNHIHLLAAFPDADAMLEQCESWKHYMARQINRSLGRRGRFWQQDGFDHLVRSADQFDYLRKYIAENPRKANLKPGEYIHYSKPL